jgi:acetyl-CoA carboxylase biotin carboxylase subunit
VDHAIEGGAKIPPFYDPLVAKVIAWDVDRPWAFDRLIAALSQFCVEGIKTTIPTNIAILMSDRYAAGDVHTGFIQELFADHSVLDELCKPLWPCM